MFFEEDKFKAVPAALKTALLTAEFIAAVLGTEGVEVGAKLDPVNETGKLEASEAGGGLRLKAAANEAG